MIIKTEEEREGIRESGKRLGQVLSMLESMVRPGVTTKELDDAAYKMITDMGDRPAFLNYAPKGAPEGFPGTVCISINEGLVHGAPNRIVRTLKEGDIVKLDSGVNHKGFFSDSALTVGVGLIKSEYRKLINATQEALDAQIAVAVVGATLGDIGHAAEEVARRYGYGYPRDLGGHSLGRTVHEQPFIRNYGKPGKGEVLVENMVLALEPMFSLGTSHDIRIGEDGWVYEMTDGAICAHTEHTVIVGKDKAEIVTLRD